MSAPPASGAPYAGEPDERPSKSQRKREMTELQKLGERLLALGAEQLARIDVPEDLREALEHARRITSHEARRRQLQYVGRLMRHVDAEPLRRALDDATGASKGAVALMHRCERLRDRLLESDEALTEFLGEFPHAEVQPLRALIRAARREHAAGQPPKHARLLYRCLHDLLQHPEGA